jgi:hypothetical protein
MNRDNQGRFSSFKRKVKNLVSQVLYFTFVCALLLSAVVGIAAFIQYKAGNYEYRASAHVATTTPQTLDTRWEENYKRDVELEMNRSGFKNEIETYARKQAEMNVKRAYITKLEQHTK